MQENDYFENKSGSRQNSLASSFPFEEINAVKIQLKPEENANSKKSTKEAWIHPLLSLLILM
jgi:hypothetical protein